MTDAPYVLGGYAVSAAAIGGYVLRMRARSRALARPAPSVTPVASRPNVDGERRPDHP